MALPAASDPPSHPDEAGVGAGGFDLTQWSMVLLAGGQADASRVALEKLCRAYWQPLFVHVRRQGFGIPEAGDLTQSFFAQLLERGSPGTADPDKGRFRSFLLRALKHFLINEWRRGQRQKRGSGQAVFALDAMNPAQRGACEPADDASPDVLYDRRWAERPDGGRIPGRLAAAARTELIAASGFRIGLEFPRATV